MTPTRPKDRVLDQIAHRETDHVPYVLGMEDSVAHALDAHYGTDGWRPLLEGYGPSSDGSVEWVSLEICADSGLLATPYCRSKIPGVYLQTTDGASVSEKVADYNLYAPTRTCNLHTTGWPGFFGDDDDQPVSGGTTPETPYDVSISSGRGISISWQDSNPGSTTVYVVERLVDGGDRVKKVVRKKSYTDTDVSSGHSYAYRVYAYNEDTGEVSAWSEQVSIDY